MTETLEEYPMEGGTEFGGVVVGEEGEEEEEENKEEEEEENKEEEEKLVGGVSGEDAENGWQCGLVLIHLRSSAVHRGIGRKGTARGARDSSVQ